MKEKCHVVCVVGLPGSGKSYLAKNLKKKHVKVVDDPQKLDEVIRMLRWLNRKRTLVIADVHLCLEKNREIAERVFATEVPWAKVVWICFENDVKACYANVKRRKKNGDDRQVEETIKSYSDMYTIPENAIQLPVWKDKVEA